MIVGAGASGVELACKLADLLAGAAVVELIEQGEELLPAARSFNRDQAREALLKRDIRLRTGTRVMAVGPASLTLQRGDGRLGSFAGHHQHLLFGHARHCRCRRSGCRC